MDKENGNRMRRGDNKRELKRKGEERGDGREVDGRR